MKVFARIPHLISFGPSSNDKNMAYFNLNQYGNNANTKKKTASPKSIKASNRLTAYQTSPAIGEMRLNAGKLATQDELQRRVRVAIASSHCSGVTPKQDEGRSCEARGSTRHKCCICLRTRQ